MKGLSAPAGDASLTVLPLCLCALVVLVLLVPPLPLVVQALCLAPTTTPSGAGCTSGSSSWQHTSAAHWQVRSDDDMSCVGQYGDTPVLLASCCLFSTLQPSYLNTFCNKQACAPPLSHQLRPVLCGWLSCLVSVVCMQPRLSRAVASRPGTSP